MVSSLKSFPTEWEREVYEFFELFKFDKLDGGSNFRLGKHQIDVCCSHENVLLIIECKTQFKNDKDEKKLKAYLDNWAGKKKEILRGIKSHEKYSHFKERNVRFLIATKNINWKKKHEKKYKYEITAYRKTKDLGIWKITKEDLDYYKEIEESIGLFGKFQLLQGLSIMPNKSEEADEINAFRIEFGGFPMYTFLENPLKLIKFCSVHRRREGSEGYQRMLDKKRLPELYNYIVSKKKVVPTNIILSFFDNESQEKKVIWNKEKDLAGGVEFGKIELPNKYGCLRIIDGQHRFFSLANKLKLSFGKKGDNVNDVKFVFTLIDKMKTPIQREIFVDVNDKGKNVPADLLWDIAGQSETDNKKAIISNTAKFLDYNKGPFNHKIKLPTKSKYGRNIGLTELCNAIRDQKLCEENIAWKEGIKYDNPYHFKIKGKPDGKKITTRVGNIILKFFSTILDNLDDKKNEDYKRFMLKGAGIYIWLGVLKRLICSKSPKMLNQQDLDSCASILKNHIEEKYPSLDAIKKINTSGYGNRDRETLLLCKELFDKKYIGFNKFESELSGPEVTIQERANELQKYLRHLLDYIMAENTEDKEKWFLNDDYVINKLRGKAKKSIEKDYRKNPEKYKPHLHWIGLDLLDVYGIIDYIDSRNDVKLKRELWKVFSKVFLDYSQMKMKMLEISYIRNPSKYGHGRPSEASEIDYRRAEQELDNFDIIFEEVFGEDFKEQIDKREEEIFPN
jgi:DGQHR domain-containing protein